MEENKNREIIIIFNIIIFTIVTVFALLLPLANLVLLKIDYKETVGIVLYTHLSGGIYDAYYKYKVKDKNYYSHDRNPPENIKKGVKINIYYFPPFPSIYRAQFDEIIEGDTTIFLDYDFHKEN